MRRHQIQKALHEIANEIAMRAALLHKKDIDEKTNSLFCMSFVCFFPKLDYLQRKALNNFANKIDEVSEALLDGAEAQQINFLYESAKNIRENLLEYPEANKIFRIAINQLVNLIGAIVNSEQHRQINYNIVYN